MSPAAGSRGPRARRVSASCRRGSRSCRARGRPGSLAGKLEPVAGRGCDGGHEDEKRADAGGLELGQLEPLAVRGRDGGDEAHERMAIAVEVVGRAEVPVAPAVAGLDGGCLDAQLGSVPPRPRRTPARPGSARTGRARSTGPQNWRTLNSTVDAGASSTQRVAASGVVGCWPIVAHAGPPVRRIRRAQPGAPPPIRCTINRHGTNHPPAAFF